MKAKLLNCLCYSVGCSYWVWFWILILSISIPSDWNVCTVQWCQWIKIVQSLPLTHVKSYNWQYIGRQNQRPQRLLVRCNITTEYRTSIKHLTVRQTVEIFLYSASTILPMQTDSNWFCGNYFVREQFDRSFIKWNFFQFGMANGWHVINRIRHLTYECENPKELKSNGIQYRYASFAIEYVHRNMTIPHLLSIWWITFGKMMIESHKNCLQWTNTKVAINWNYFIDFRPLMDSIRLANIHKHKYKRYNIEYEYKYWSVECLLCIELFPMANESVKYRPKMHMEESRLKT